ncbi:MAG: hypothetical protein LRY51_13785 [Geovibrio sp.]|nr:hypothetical protein [Geovibrio sp.]
MKKMLVTLLAVICAASAYAAPVKVGISQIVEHPALDATRKGIIDAVTACGYAEGKDIVYDVQIAQGNVATANQIAKKFVGDKNNLVIGIATPNSQSLKQVVEKSGLSIPVIFSAVTDPVGAKLVKSIEKPGGNITGVSDSPLLRLSLRFSKSSGLRLKMSASSITPENRTAALLLTSQRRLPKSSA